MPTGQNYSQETKELMLNVIKFIEGEKNGATIPLYNVNDRIMSALQISHRSLVNLKNELKELEEEEQKALKNIKTSACTEDHHHFTRYQGTTSPEVRIRFIQLPNHQQNVEVLPV
jgi:hypothetical protein